MKSVLDLIVLQRKIIQIQALTKFTRLREATCSHYPKNIEAQQIMRNLKMKIKNLENLKFLTYTKVRVPHGYKSLGVSFYFRGDDRSLSEDEMGEQLTEFYKFSTQNTKSLTPLNLMKLLNLFSAMLQPALCDFKGSCPFPKNLFEWLTPTNCDHLTLF